MRKISMLGLTFMGLMIVFANVAYAHCGLCANDPAYAEEESSETISGKIICLGCTLKKEEGAQAQCSIYGHKNGLRTSDGRIWTFLENNNSAELIDNHDLAGKKVEIKGKKYTNANYIEVKSYKVLER